MVKLEPGDIVATRAKLWQKPLTKLVSPYTDNFHFFLVGAFVPDENDWVIYESLVSRRGVRIGRLSFYTGKRIKIYRIDEHIGKLAIREISKYGRRDWDYMFIPRVILGTGVKYWIKHGLKKIPYNEVPSYSNKKLICTELVTESYRKYVVLVADGIAATPSALEQAYLDGKMQLIFDDVCLAVYYKK